MKIILLFAVTLNLIIHSNGQCRWRGKSPLCSPSSCERDELQVAEASTSNSSDFGEPCREGTKKFCCKLNSCYLSGNAPNCSSSSCKEGDVQLGSTTDRSEATCSEGTKKFCCPGVPSQRVKVTLYEDSDYRGPSESYDEENDCINVERPKTASSVDTHNTCVRAFNKIDCEGESIALSPGSPDHRNLKKRKFEDIIESVAPCLANDHERGDLIKHQWNPQFLDDVVTFGYISSLAVDRTNLPKPVEFFQTGYGGRTESMQAVIRRRHLDTGTPPTKEGRNHVHTLGRKNDDAGHILGARLGGSGTDTRNLFPQSSHFNRGVFAQFEGMVSDIVSLHGQATYSVNLQYQGTETRPNRIFVRIESTDRDTGTTQVIMNDFLNP